MRLHSYLILIFMASISFAETDSLPLPDNLVADGLPPIPTALADAIHPYTEFRGAGITSWHPTRREMLIYTPFAHTSTRRTDRDTDIWLVNPADPKSDRLIAQLAGGGWTPQDFSPDDHRLILLEAISVNESYLWILDISTGEKSLITPRDQPEK